MKVLFICLLVLFSISGALVAAELDPALAALDTQRQQSVKKLSEDSDLSLKVARDTYSVALDLAAKAAGDAGDSAASDAIGKELAVANRGYPKLNPPAGFPKKLQTARKAFVKAVEKADDDLAKEIKRVNADYVLAITKLGMSNPGLAEAIAAEKRRMQGFGPVFDLQTGLAGTTWKSVNRGDLLVFGPHHLANKNVVYETPDATTLVLHWEEGWVDTLKLDESGQLMLKNGQPDRKIVPPGSK